MRLAAYRGGGISRYARELYAALAALDELTLLPLWSRREREAPQTGARLRTPPHHRLERHTIPLELRLHRLRYGVYHAPDFIAPRLKRRPVVATVHDLAFEAWPGDLAPDSLAYYRRLRQSRTWTDAWITPSQWTARELSDRFDIDTASIHVIPHGESLGLLCMPVVPREQRGNYVLAVGTVEPRKRYGMLLDALGQWSGGPEVVIAGQRGWQVPDLEQRLHRTPRVTWYQAADDEHLRDLYRHAVALAVPSRAEGFGLPALEAMAAGTPVLSSGGGALREVTGDAAQTVLGDSGAAWGDAITRITEDETRWWQLSAAGRQRAAAFSWERAAQETAAVYRALARR
jgi:glycosyltransferase involved in cell wall biosynthesis